MVQFSKCTIPWGWHRIVSLYHICVGLLLHNQIYTFTERSPNSLCTEDLKLHTHLHPGMTSNVGHVLRYWWPLYELSPKAAMCILHIVHIHRVGIHNNATLCTCTLYRTRQSCALQTQKVVCVLLRLSQLQEEVLKRQLEVAALENTQEIKMRELEHKEKVQ